MGSLMATNSLTILDLGPLTCQSSVSFLNSIFIIFLFTFCIDTGSFKVVHISVELTPTQRGLGLLPTFLPESPE